MDVTIDGARYVPAGEAAPRIGVGITTHNRPDAFTRALKEHLAHLPAGARIVIVDDASTIPVAEADHRFETNVGIARAKNKCLELLAGCEHIFLFDDDAWPLVDGWWRPYVDSAEPHLMRIFEDVTGPKKIGDITCLYRDSEHIAWSGARGLMLYLHRSVLDAVGGMDPAYGQWGFEHVDYSNRIHAAGLTTWRYADVAGAEQLIYSMDEHCEVERSVPLSARKALVATNGPLHEAQKNTPKYCEYREQRDVVITCLFTGQPDPQRNKHMASDPKLLAPLLASLQDHHAVVLHDCLTTESTDTVEYVPVETSISPYFQRWITAWQYLRDHPNIRYAWCVDGTDVELLHDPFPHMRPGRLYIGSEQTTVDLPWLREAHQATQLHQFIDTHPGRQLLNAGLVGGDRATLMGFLHDLIRVYFDNATDQFKGREKHDLGVGDMATLNMVAWTRWADRLVHGSQINTVFRANNREDPVAWWRHK